MNQDLTAKKSVRKTAHSWRVIFCSLLLIAVSCSGAELERVMPPVPEMDSAESLKLLPYVGGVGSESIVIITNAGDERLFVGTQTGWVRVAVPDEQYPIAAFLAEPYLDLRDRVEVSFEEGLLSLAFHPDYATNGYAYVTYTEKGSGDILLDRYTVETDAPNSANIASRLEMLRIAKPRLPSNEKGYSPVHNAGDIHFRQDGYLYIVLGDGGPDPYDLSLVPGDPSNNAQRTDTLLGKMLRIDVNADSDNDPDCGNGQGYTIPKDNPFVGRSGKCDEIWSLGWRNPWRFTIDAVNGDMYISDVGEWEREEINFEPFGTEGGRNYGWHCFEGEVDFRAVAHVQGHCDDQKATYTFPLHASDHANGACSIIGGHVYRGTQQPTLEGQYIYADYCSRTFTRILTHDHAQAPRDLPYVIDAPWGDQPPQWSAFGVGSDGEIYVGAYLHDAIYRISADN